MLKAHIIYSKLGGKFWPIAGFHRHDKHVIHIPTCRYNNHLHKINPWNQSCPNSGLWRSCSRYFVYTGINIAEEKVLFLPHWTVHRLLWWNSFKPLEDYHISKTSFNFWNEILQHWSRLSNLLNRKWYDFMMTHWFAYHILWVHN